MKLLYDCPMYNLKTGDEIEVKYEPTSEYLLRYGEVLTDDEWEDTDQTRINQNCERIRIISYNGKLWYHKMCNGKIVKCKKIGVCEG